MVNKTPADKPITIEPLTKDEKKDRVTTSEKVEDDIEFPTEWRDKNLTEAVEKGFKYYRRRMGDKVYMVLRKGKKDRGLGLWSDEKERKLFGFFPNIQASAGILRPDYGSPSTKQGRGFLSIPIARVAIIPRDYVPSLNVLRYFQIVKEQGFPGEFSEFINDIVTEHFKHCHGIILPVMVQEDNIEVRQNDTTCSGN